MKYLFVILSLLVISCQAEAETANGSAQQNAIYQDLSNEEFSDGIMENNILLLDVRSPQEYEDLHIPGAMLIPVQELNQRIEEIESLKDHPVYVYCRSGNRSRTASQILLDNGFSQVYNLDRGISSWASQGYPTE